MLKLIASLSLVLTTGINALTSDNLVQDPYVEFLDSTYDYPNIHNHGTWQQDPYIYTGNINYEHSAVAEYDINLDTLKFEITQANYGYKYSAYSTGEGAIALALIDADGNMIDDAIHEFDITTVNQWIDVDKVYNDMDKLSQAKQFWLGIGGVSDRNGTDDIRITDIYLTYDYQEIPLDLITDNSLKTALNDSVYDFPALDLPEIKVEEPVEVKVEPIEQPSAATPAPSNLSKPKVSNDSVKEVKSAAVVEPKSTKVKSSTKTKKSKEVTKNESKTKTRTKSRTAGVAEALETTSMVSIASNSINTNDPGSFFGSIGMDFESYTGVELVELIQLTEPSFYEEPDFYDTEIALTDNIQLNNIDFYKGTNWYGSNTQFY